MADIGNIKGNKDDKINTTAEQANEQVRFGDGRPTWSSKLLVILLIVTSLLVSGVLAAGVVAKMSNNNLVKEDQYQAVFLENGQVYFGQLSNVDSSYVTLTDIYYLQVNQQVQPDRDTSSEQQPQVSLTKLGNELHGPEDAMFIDRNKIVFWENLKTEGRITQAIAELDQNGASSTNGTNNQNNNGTNNGSGTNGQNGNNGNTNITQ